MLIYQLFIHLIKLLNYIRLYILETFTVRNTWGLKNPLLCINAYCEDFNYTKNETL